MTHVKFLLFAIVLMGSLTSANAVETEQTGVLLRCADGAGAVVFTSEERETLNRTCSPVLRVGESGRLILSAWTLLGFTKTYIAFYNPQTLAPEKGNWKMWFMLENLLPLSTEDNPPKRYSSTQVLKQVNCAERKMADIIRILRTKQLASGDVVATYSVPVEKAVFESVAPDSPAEAMLMTVCNAPSRAKNR